MRGLDTAVLIAKARVAEFIYGVDAGNEIALDAFNEAVHDGMNDYKAGFHQPPAVYSDDNGLSSGWNIGWELEAEREQIAYCSWCNDSSLENCPKHA